MSFDHILVSKLQAPTERDLHTQEQTKDWPHKIDGIPVRKEVLDLCKELRKSYSGYRFHAGRGGVGNSQVNIMFSDGVQKTVYSDVHVYIEGSDYMVGRIGYGKKYGLNEVDAPVYMVQSRKISNDKFGEHRDQYYLSFAKDFKKALKVALSKLTPYSPREMAHINFTAFKNNVSEVRQRSLGKLNNILSPIQDRNVLLMEMRNLISANVHFATPQFIEAAEQITQADKDWEEMKRKPFNAYYVYVRMVGGEQWVDVVDVPDVYNRNSHSVETCPITSMNINDLPDDIKGKLAVLTIATNDQYMEQMGRRVSDKSFWVER
jgi:transcription antitermination factor NusG